MSNFFYGNAYGEIFEEVEDLCIFMGKQVNKGILSKLDEGPATRRRELLAGCAEVVLQQVFELIAKNLMIGTDSAKTPLTVVAKRGTRCGDP